MDEWANGARAGVSRPAEVGEGAEVINNSRTSPRNLGYRSSHRYSTSLVEDTEFPGGTARILSDTCPSSSTNDTRTSSSDMKVNEVNLGSSMSWPKTEVSLIFHEVSYNYHCLITISPVPDNKSCPRMQSDTKNDAHVWSTDGYRKIGSKLKHRCDPGRYRHGMHHTSCQRT